ncbi:MAG: hypothetical protein LBB18_01375 [Puniceicoccales bacterium]|nr:hypothetical protein [Puniceicoccales bacterium]
MNPGVSTIRMRRKLRLSLGGQRLRKDANFACLAACELAAYAKSLKKTLPDIRDDMYLKYGYFGESVVNL